MKFRVWNKALNKFDDQDYLLDSGGVLYYYNSDTWDLRKAKPKENHVVQRFTGLLDKSGKEIYEGDIIKVHHFEDWGDVVGYDLNVTVFYHDKLGSFRTGTQYVLDNHVLGARGSELNSDCEVISNIFEQKT